MNDDDDDDNNNNNNNNKNTLFIEGGKFSKVYMHVYT